MTTTPTSCTATWAPLVWRWVSVVVSNSELFFGIPTAPDVDPVYVERIKLAPRRPHQIYPCPAYQGQAIPAMPRAWWRVVPRRRQFNHAQRARQLRRSFVQALRKGVVA